MKIKYLWISFLVLSVCPQPTITTAEEESIVSSRVTNQMIADFQAPLQMKNTITFSYHSVFPSLTIIDSFDTSHRVNQICVNQKTLQEKFISKDSQGNAIESYISISNTVETRKLLDTSGEGILFDSYYASPFSLFKNLTHSQFLSYFTVTTQNGTYVWKATDYGYSVLSNALLSFYADYDGMIWDRSLVRSIENLFFTTDLEGNLSTLSYDKIKKDCFGGIQEHHDIAMTRIEKTPDLLPVVGSLSDEVKSIYESKMAQFQALLNEGNFAQEITIKQSRNTLIQYRNYYSLNDDETRQLPPMALSSLLLQDASYGNTYVGLLDVGDETTSYQRYGISPAADYYAAINDTTYSSINEVIPQYQAISSDFLTYNERTDTYVMRLSDALYADNDFSNQLLKTLFGVLDPCANFIGMYFYQNGTYYFQSLTMHFDELGYLSGTLTYLYAGVTLTSTFSFSEIGAINLAEKEDVQDVIDYLFS